MRYFIFSFSHLILLPHILNQKLIMKKTSLTFASLALCFGIASAQTATPPPTEVAQQAAPVATTPAPVTTPTPVTTTAPQATPVVAAPEQKVTVYGFVRNDMYYNTRKNLDLRDGVLDVYPLDASNLTTATNDDDKAVPQLGFSAIVTRLGVKFAGIKAFGANASGTLESDFFGITNGASAAGVTAGIGAGSGTENLLRLRHAYVKLDWTKTSLLVGQYWNPNFIIKCFPGTANFSTGIPFNPFSFVPQIRLEHKLTPELSVTAMTFGYDLAGFSPAGAFPAGSGVDAFKYSTIPSFAGPLTFENKSFLAGAGIETNVLRPRTQNTTGRTTNIETNLLQLNFMAYAKYTSKSVVLKAYTNYGQSYSQYVGFGGFAEYKDSSTQMWKYVAHNQLNAWGEIIITNHAMFQPALFIGYAQNLGLASDISKFEAKFGTTSFYGRGITGTRSYHNMLRLAPRLDILSGKMKFSFEYEFSTIKWAATTGTASTETAWSYKANTSSSAFDATNHRLLFLMVYNF